MLLSQPFSGSSGLESPRMKAKPWRIARPGPLFAGRAYMNLPGFAFTQVSNSCAVFGGLGTFAGL
ncbi:hypothetical protein ACVWXQ_010248 [Bradyrhizobium sp. S3.14.4]